ncbi:MAG: hypothetical protein A3C06_00900 [Candidatus Taylorbacteria bacterium RIFCSPHIGHO2_02_FULL_46_13]|uniref:SpoVT-AbrB domain-containing protein n=2 Tax=Parcubacteria group TaxID=1794811 RepID=A0A1G2HVG8_9BACT|nr:MAG: hypothetical protein A2822_01340 [Candidatus Staskawiczbacteria bacterium RIFCSPHIGHO2_01_FULL_41_41]OHA27261.1 MAG: hypothetical protein A3C06_00900 [Candidatus Taylorbacteria bacterium RIFCSPHIGHO2_02_FULL_46_13]
MIQKVLKVGSSAAVTIPKKSLEELDFKIGDRVSVSADYRSKSFTVRKVVSLKKGKRTDKIAQLTMNFINRYRKDLEALADK